MKHPFFLVMLMLSCFVAAQESPPPWPDEQHAHERPADITPAFEDGFAVQNITLEMRMPMGAVATMTPAGYYAPAPVLTIPLDNMPDFSAVPGERIRDVEPLSKCILPPDQAARMLKQDDAKKSAPDVKADFKVGW